METDISSFATEPASPSTKVSLSMKALRFTFIASHLKTGWVNSYLTTQRKIGLALVVKTVIWVRSSFMAATLRQVAANMEQASVDAGINLAKTSPSMAAKSKPREAKEEQALAEALAVRAIISPSTAEPNEKIRAHIVPVAA